MPIWLPKNKLIETEDTVASQPAPDLMKLEVR